jgi:hypothetical protein
MAKELKPYEKQLGLFDFMVREMGSDGKFTKIETVLYDYINMLKDDGLLDESDNIEYYYTDKRQLELFSDEDFEYDSSYAEHCK